MERRRSANQSLPIRARRISNQGATCSAPSQPVRARAACVGPALGRRPGGERRKEGSTGGVRSLPGTCAIRRRLDESTSHSPLSNDDPVDDPQRRADARPPTLLPRLRPAGEHGAGSGGSARAVDRLTGAGSRAGRARHPPGRPLDGAGSSFPFPHAPDPPSFPGASRPGRSSGCVHLPGMPGCRAAHPASAYLRASPLRRERPSHAGLTPETSTDEPRRRSRVAALTRVAAGHAV